MMALQFGSAIFLSLMAICLCLAFLSNLGVIIVVLRNKKMRNATNFLICNLAISDLLLGTFVLPQNLHDMSHTEEFYEGELACKLVNALPIFCIFSSIYSLVAISVDRYRAIALNPPKPLQVKTAKRLVVLIWLAAIVICIPVAVEYTVYEHIVTTFENVISTGASTDYHGITVSNQHIITPQPEVAHSNTNLTMPMEDTVTLSPNSYTNQTVVWERRFLECGSDTSPRELGIFNGIFLLLICYAIPSICIWLNYALLIRFIFSYTREMPSDTTDQIQGRSAKAGSLISKRRVRILKMLVIVAALFGCCWLPYFTLFTYTSLTGKGDSSSSDGPINMLRIFLSVFSVSYNACLYAIYNPMFREGFAKLLRCSKYLRSGSIQPAEIDISCTVSPHSLAPPATTNISRARPATLQVISTLS